MRYIVAFSVFAVLAIAAARHDAPTEARERVAGIHLGGPIGKDGTEVTCDLPVSERIKNIGSKVDGAGMCVMSSVEMSSRWANVERLRGLRDWCAKQPGGGYPAKVDKQLQQYCTEKRIDVPGYLQYEGKSPDILKAALRSGRMPSVTYNGRDGVRYRGTIAHMTNLIHLDDRWAVVLDNNGIGATELLWMSPEDFFQRWRGSGNGWAVVLLAPPPPPLPRKDEG